MNTNERDALVALAAEIRASLGNGTTSATRRRWAIEIEALAAPAEGDGAVACPKCGAPAAPKGGVVDVEKVWREWVESVKYAGLCEETLHRACFQAGWEAAPAAPKGGVVDEAWLAKARELYGKCAVFPETTADGITALLTLRNHVEKILATGEQP